MTGLSKYRGEVSRVEATAAYLRVTVWSNDFYYSLLLLPLINLKLCRYARMWIAKSFWVCLTWTQMCFPCLKKKWEKGKFESRRRWELTFACVSPQDQTHKTNTLFQFQETRERPLWCLRACPVHTECELSIRPILDVFHLLQTCFPYMWCSSALLEDVFGLHRKTLWQMWEDILCLNKSQLKYALTDSLGSLLLTARCDFSQHGQLFL